MLARCAGLLAVIGGIMSDTLVAEKRTDWRRHDIVYSPEVRMWGTVVSVEPNGLCTIEWANGVQVERRAELLDEWQRINDERGKP